MIEKMRKYSFVLFHQDYESFLTQLQKLGVVHVEKNKVVTSDIMVKQQELIGEYSETIKFLQKVQATDAVSTNLPSKALLNKIKKAREERDQLNRQYDVVKKQIHELEPWGHFDRNLAQRIKAYGLGISYYTCLKNHFKPEWQEQYPIQIINEVNGILYFALVYFGEKPVIEAESYSFHEHSLNEVEKQAANIIDQIKGIDDFYKSIAPTAIEMFNTELDTLIRDYEFEDAMGQANDEAEDQVKVLIGWIPISREAALKEYLESDRVIHLANDANPQDNVPIKLRNNWFSRLFEPISKMYMLPFYNEFDLTPMFAPFFMLFFGFCNADIAYGLVIIAIGFLLNKKGKTPVIKSYAKLIIFFGIASVIMGFVMGSLLGYDMKKMAAVGDKIIIRENGQIFNLALLLGAIQILFGVLISTVKSIKQSGFRHGLAPFGTFLFILAMSIIGSTMLGAKPGLIHQYAPYLMYAGLALILLFNAPGKNILINILGGIWVLYNVVTGFFGDILSYIRLFALGVSSAILGFVVNSIGARMLGIPIAGYIIFPIFLIIGHTINLALGALSGFVHPMRLTFVEFFKNAGFAGPGIEYKPFGKTK